MKRTATPVQLQTRHSGVFLDLNHASLCYPFNRQEFANCSTRENKMLYSLYSDTIMQTTPLHGLLLGEQIIICFSLLHV